MTEHDHGTTSAIVVADRDGRALLTLTRPAALLALATVGPVVAAVTVLHRVAPGAHWGPSAGLVALAVAAAALPDSGIGLATLAALVTWWVVAVPDGATAAAWVVAGCGLVFHAALAYGAAGPPGCSPSPAVLGRVAGRCGWLLVLTGGLAVVVELTAGGGEPPPLVVGGTLALVGALPWLAARPR